MSQEIDTTKIAIFQKKEIRKIIFKNEWWFSVIDVVEALTGTDRPRKYWSDLKRKIENEGYVEVSENIGQLKLLAPDGKKRETDCANTETLFRIIQSIPSPKAEPFKRWLAKVGYERVQEIEDPELAAKRARAIYRAKGYPEGWIEKRMRGIEIRETLTNEWKNRNVGGDDEYAILTAEISKATFDMTPSQYKKFKGLKRQNLRDHTCLPAGRWTIWSSSLRCWAKRPRRKFPEAKTRKDLTKTKPPRKKEEPSLATHAEIWNLKAARKFPSEEIFWGRTRGKF